MLSRLGCGVFMPSGGGPAHRAYGRSVVFAASALLHLALLLVLAAHLSRVRNYAESPSIKIVLVPPSRLDTAAADRKPVRASRPLARPPLSPPPLPNVIIPPAATEAPSASSSDGLAEKAQRALRGLAGCDDVATARLTPEERERCENRRWAGSAPADRRLNLDPSGRYVENPEPYLVRKPKNGCRVRATGDVDAMGDSGNARVGFGCALSF
jgi:hypothetical protein